MIWNMIVYADCNIQQNKLAKNRRSILIFAKRFRKEHVLTISVSAFKCTSERSIMPAHTHSHTICLPQSISCIRLHFSSNLAQHTLAKVVFSFEEDFPHPSQPSGKPNVEEFSPLELAFYPSISQHPPHMHQKPPLERKPTRQTSAVGTYR